MSVTRLVVRMFSAGLMIFGAGTVSGQEFPNKPIRILASEAGGGGDFAARLIAQGLTSRVGQPVITDNRSGIVPQEIVSKAPPDGYTLLVAGSSLWITPLLRKTSYDAVRDFLPISLTHRTPNVLVVHPSLPAKSVKELIALAKAKPGELNYSSSGIGGSIHLAGELFNAMAGVNIVHVPYKGTGPAVNDLIGARVQLMFVNTTVVAPHIKAGRLRALAITSAEPSTLFPDLPTVAAILAGYESAAMTAVFAPAKTPAAIIRRLNQEIVRDVNQADVKEKLLNAGIEVVGSSSNQLLAKIKSEIAVWGKLIKDVGIKAD